MKSYWFIVVTLCLLRTTLAQDQCACATTNVHVRDGVGLTANILSTLSAQHCLPFKGYHETDEADANWANVDFHGKDGWIHENYVTIGNCSSTPGSNPGVTHHPPTDPNLPGCPAIVRRAEWGARDPTHYAGHLPATPKYMFLHHGASSPCFTKQECIHKVQGYQNWHMDGHGWNDIGYSFVVGEDGNVYEARGWDTIGAHTKGYNSVGLAICVIGNFMDHVPNDLALNAVRQMIQCGHDNGKLTSNYTLRGHRDVGTTACPGTAYYNLIRTWPHYW